MDMGTKLASLRRQKGLSQLELAEALNVSRQAVSMWESGATIPSIDNLILLGRLYEVSVDELLGISPAKKDAEAKAEEHAEKKKTRSRLLIAAVLVLAALVIAVSAYFLGRGESDAEVIQLYSMEDLEEEEASELEGLETLPWRA